MTLAQFIQQAEKVTQTDSGLQITKVDRFPNTKAIKWLNTVGFDFIIKFELVEEDQRYIYFGYAIRYGYRFAVSKNTQQVVAVENEAVIYLCVPNMNAFWDLLFIGLIQD